MQVRFILKGHTRDNTPLKSVAINPGITPTMVVAKNIMVITTMEDTKEAMEDTKEVMDDTTEIMVDPGETITMAIIMEMVITVLTMKGRKICLM